MRHPIDPHALVSRRQTSASGKEVRLTRDHFVKAFRWKSPLGSDNYFFRFAASLAVD